MWFYINAIFSVVIFLTSASLFAANGADQLPENKWLIELGSSQKSGFDYRLLSGYQVPFLAGEDVFRLLGSQQSLILGFGHKRYDLKGNQMGLQTVYSRELVLGLRHNIGLEGNWSFVLDLNGVIEFFEVNSRFKPTQLTNELEGSFSYRFKNGINTAIGAGYRVLTSKSDKTPIVVRENHKGQSPMLYPTVRVGYQF